VPPPAQEPPEEPPSPPDRTRAEAGAEEGALEVTIERAGATLAALLRQLRPGLSWSRARELCRLGRVRVGGEAAADPALRPPAGSRVELLPARGGQPGASGPGTAARQPPLVVYADLDVVVVRKPPGVLTVPFERGDRDTLVALTRVALRRLDPAGRVTLRAVQRLDRDTSGLVVFARSVTAQRRLQEQFAAHEVQRHYLAIAHGDAAAATYDTVLVEDRGDGLRGSWPAPPPQGRRPGGRPIDSRPGRGAVDSRPGRGAVDSRPGGRPRDSRAKEGPVRGAPPAEGRRAVTHVQPIEPLCEATLVCCTLESGRTHQIRIHLAEAGHPLVGEKVYNRDYAGPVIEAPRPMLHAAALGFRHPRDRGELVFEEPPPADFQEMLSALRPMER
jgi:23S rRNA pseudouridine1911/1915/1917 synthase